MGRTSVRVLMAIVLASIAFATGAVPPAGARAPDDVGGGRVVRPAASDLLFTYPRCQPGRRWSDVPIDAVTAIGPGRVRLNGHGVPCRTPLASDALAVVPGTPSATEDPHLFVYYSLAHPFTVEMSLPVGTSRVCTLAGPRTIARCWSAQVGAMPDGSPTVPVIGADLGFRPRGRPEPTLRRLLVTGVTSRARGR